MADPTTQPGGAQPGNGQQGAAQPGNSSLSQELIQAINAAVASHMRPIRKKLDALAVATSDEAMAKRFEEHFNSAITALAGDAEEGQEGKEGTAGQQAQQAQQPDPRALAMERRLAELEAGLAQRDQALEAARHREISTRLEASLRQQLGGYGIAGPIADAAVALFGSRGQIVMGDDGATALMRTADALGEEQFVPLADGIKSWAASPEGKAMVPAQKPRLPAGYGMTLTGHGNVPLGTLPASAGMAPMGGQNGNPILMEFARAFQAHGNETGAAQLAHLATAPPSGGGTGER